MEPVFKELAATFTDVAFAKIDVDELQVDYGRFQLPLRWLPGVKMEYFFYFSLGAGGGAGVDGGGDADVCAGEEGEGGGQGGRSSQEEGPQEEDPAPQGLKRPPFRTTERSFLADWLATEYSVNNNCVSVIVVIMYDSGARLS